LALALIAFSAFMRGLPAAASLHGRGPNGVERGGPMSPQPSHSRADHACGSLIDADSAYMSETEAAAEARLPPAND